MVSPVEETHYWPFHPQLRMLGAGREDGLRSCNGWFTACKKEEAGARGGVGGPGDGSWRRKRGEIDRGEALSLFKVCEAFFLFCFLWGS